MGPRIREISIPVEVQRPPVLCISRIRARRREPVSREDLFEIPILLERFQQSSGNLWLRRGRYCVIGGAIGTRWRWIGAKTVDGFPGVAMVGGGHG